MYNNKKSRDQEYYDKGLLYNFEKKYINMREKEKKKLDGIASDTFFNERLVDKFIIGQKTNPFFRQREKYIEIGSPEYYALINWTLPKKTFRYTLLNGVNYKIDDNVINDLYKYDPIVKRVSFIPIVGKKFLLGQFYDYQNTDRPILADFGGSCNEKIDEPKESSINCGLRELRDEAGEKIKNYAIEKLKNRDVLIFKGEDENEYSIKYEEENKKEEYDEEEYDEEEYYENEQKYEDNYVREDIYFILFHLDLETANKIILESKKREYPDGKAKTERFGQIALYEKKDIYNFKYRMSPNLNDFIEFITHLKCEKEFFRCEKSNNECFEDYLKCKNL